ncbi:hypothetical protein CHUAL_003998 [Chamberlinius hualienensis]
MGSKPKVIVFDLDYTLWPLYVDCGTCPPFSKDELGFVVDKRDQRIKLYKDVPEILKKLHTEGYLLGIASRTTAPDSAQALLNIMEIDKYFSFKEMYPGCKVIHFRRIAADSGVDLKDMIFFDDEHRNIVDLKRLGVTSILVNRGMDFKALEEGFHTFKKDPKSNK